MLRDGERPPSLLADAVLGSADPFIFLDEHGLIQIWNLGAELLFGWTEEEALGADASMLTPVDGFSLISAEELEEPRHESVVVQNHGTTLVTKAGAPVPVKVTITLIRDASGTLQGSAINVRDVTREHQLERELRWRIGEMEMLDEVNRALQATLDSQRILRIVLTAFTAGSGLGFNRAFLFLVSGDMLEARMGIGSSNWEEAERMWPRVADKPDLSSVIDYVLSEEDAFPTVVRGLVDGWRVSLSDQSNALVECLRRPQTIVWPKTDISGAGVAERLQSPMFVIEPLIHSGKAIGVVLADNVVTNRPVDQHAIRLLRLLAGSAASALSNADLHGKVLRHALDLEEANEQIEKQRDLLVHSERMAALGRVAAAISHEIQGPLVPIGGFARAMRRDVDDASPHAEMLDFIVEEVDRLQRVVKGVTSLASMPLPQLQPVSFAGLVETTYAVYGPKAHARGISLDMDVPDDIPDPDIDDDQWHEVLLNLVSNAIEATLNGGRILTSLRLRENRYVVTVTDTGAGVPPEEIPKAFAAFFSTQPVAHGAGLNIVAAIVQRHFGRVTVESSVGKGTSVKIDFPAADELHRLVNAARSTMAENQDIATLDPLTVTTFKSSS